MTRKTLSLETDSTRQDLPHARLLPPPDVSGVGMGSRDTAGAGTHLSTAMGAALPKICLQQLSTHGGIML